MSKIEISFQIPSLPPPHAYALHISLEQSADQAKVTYQKEFLGRDSISKEEIVEEGYSEQDDIAWEGALPSIWFDETLALVNESPMTSEPQENSVCHLAYGAQQGFAQNISAWEYLLEELFQALLEKEEEEAPLFMKISFNKSTWLLKASFLDKSFTVNSNVIDWARLREILVVLEEMETSPKGQTQLKPEKHYISFDDKLHFELIGKKSAEPLQRILHDMLLGN